MLFKYLGAFLCISGVSCEQYFLLCDVLPEDRDLRQFLQKQKLVSVTYIYLTHKTMLIHVLIEAFPPKTSGQEQLSVHFTVSVK